MPDNTKVNLNISDCFRANEYTFLLNDLLINR